MSLLEIAGYQPYKALKSLNIVKDLEIAHPKESEQSPILPSHSYHLYK